MFTSEGIPFAACDGVSVSINLDLSMRGAALFLGTIALVVPSVRTALERYASLTVARFAAQSPFSEIILASIGIVTVLLLLLTHQRNSEQPPVYRVRRETRGHSVADLEMRIRQEARSRKSMPAWQARSARGGTSPRRSEFIGWLLRLRRRLAYQLGARIS